MTTIDYVIATLMALALALFVGCSVVRPTVQAFEQSAERIERAGL